MYNYHTGLIWTIDIALAGAVIVLIAAIIFYAAFREYVWKVRIRALLDIKKHLYELALSGKRPGENTTPPFIARATARQFLDVQTNRNMGEVFFNDSEKDLFKEYFIAPGRVSSLERVAARAFDKWRRIEAIMVLGYAATASSANTLKKTVLGKDEDVAYFSSIALGQIKTPASARALLAFLKSKPLYRHKIVSILENFPSEISEDVVKLVKDKDPQVRLWAIRLLSKIAPGRYLKEIIQNTLDDSGEVRAAACECLGRSAAPEARGPLVKCLEDDDWLVRVNTVKALSALLGDKCIPEIISLINDPSLSVIDSVKAAITAHIEPALPYIKKFFEGRDELAKKVSVEALGNSGYIIKLLQYTMSSNEKEKAASIDLLKSMIESHAHFGIETAVAGFGEDKRKKLLEIISGIDRDFAEHVDKKVKGEIAEL